MSKRFGRNQKRKMRAQLYEAEGARVNSEAALRYADTKRRQALEEVADLRAALGPHFIGLDPQEIVAEVDRGDSFELFDPDGPVTVCIMRGSVHTDVAQRHVHFYVRLADKEVGYAISRDALLGAPLTYMTRKIAEQMAPALLREIRHVL